MPDTRPSVTIWQDVANEIGCDIPTIKAVFEVEAAGKFFEKDGKLVRRFEPHHVPKSFWPRLGFNPGKQAPWRASLKIRTSERERMFAVMQAADSERAYKATSWGAPQIMGFNHAAAGFASATALVKSFEQSADNQIRGFVAFIVSEGLDTHLRSQDWYAFASRYNGPGKARDYAAKIESAYRRQSGGKVSATVLRIGAKGPLVEELQEWLNMLDYELTVDATFGRATQRAVKEFQKAHDLKTDGVVGATTRRVLEEQVKKALKSRDIEPPVSVLEPQGDDRTETAEDITIDTVIQRGSAIVGTGGLASIVTGLDGTAQQLLIGGVILGAIFIGAVWLLKRWK